MGKKKDKRFGATAINKGFITKDQLIEALVIQATENIEKEEHRLLGEILVGMGLMTPSQVDDVLEAMSNRIACAIAIGR